MCILEGFLYPFQGQGTKKPELLSDGAMMEDQLSGVRPVFFMQRELEQAYRATGGDDRMPILTTYEVCTEVSRLTGDGSVDGAQNIRGTWRIYLKENVARMRLVVRKSMMLRNVKVTLFDQNPTVVKQQSPDELREKITVKDIPLSYSGEEIQRYLSERGVVMKTPLMYAKDRDFHGRLTEYKNGDRYLYVVSPVEPPLPRQATIGSRRCRIFHKSQFDNRCKACNGPGHKAGDETCPALNTEDNTIAFKSYTNILSNCADTTIVLNGQEFKSAQHAFEWEKATHLDEHNQALANEILEAEHAGKARKLTRDALDSWDVTDWEQNATQIMRDILEAKAEQCETFKKMLLDTQEKTIAASIPDRFWGTGLEPQHSVTTKRDYWPGHNMLGALMIELREQLQSEAGDTVTTPTGDDARETPPDAETLGETAPTDGGSPSSEENQPQGENKTVENDTTIQENNAVGTQQITFAAAVGTETDRGRTKHKLPRKVHSRSVGKSPISRNSGQNPITEFLSAKRKHLTGSPTDKPDSKLAKQDNVASNTDVK